MIGHGNVKNNRINQLNDKRSLKNKFLFWSFAAFRASLMQEKVADCHLFLRIRCVFVVFLYVTKLLSVSVA